MGVSPLGQDQVYVDKGVPFVQYKLKPVQDLFQGLVAFNKDFFSVLETILRLFID